MSSRKGTEGLDPEALTRDLPTTAEDVRALRSHRPNIPLRELSDWNWLSAERQFGAPQRTGTSAGWEPFELAPGRPASEQEAEPSGGSVKSFGDDRSPGPGAGDTPR